jgi:KDO2-lipid IV(A) lauroyltransferase
LLAILADVDTETMGVFVDFFNRPAYTPAGPIVISQKTGAPLLPVFMVRQPDNTHLMIIEPALKLQATGQRQQDLIENTQRFTHIIETYIRRYPEQWIWMHDRWKTVQS